MGASPEVERLIKRQITVIRVGDDGFGQEVAKSIPKVELVEFGWAYKRKKNTDDSKIYRSAK